MKRYLLGIMPCTQLKASAFEEHVASIFTTKHEAGMKQLLAIFSMLVSCLVYSSTLKKEATPKSLLAFNGLYGAISQKREPYL
jgi:hypothetical protein